MRRDARCIGAAIVVAAFFSSFLLSMATGAHAEGLKTEMFLEGEPACEFEVMSGRVLVKLGRSVDIAAVEEIASDFGMAAIDSFPQIGWYLLETESALEVQSLVDVARKDDRVEHATPDYVMRFGPSESRESESTEIAGNLALPTQAYPNDPLYPSQWHLNDIISHEGWIAAQSAWDYQTGVESVIIAIIDTGVDYDHPDLSANIWSGRGYDFNPAWFDDDDPMDDIGHGTEVAGAACAVTNNSYGIAGVAWNCRIMCVGAWAGTQEFVFTNCGTLAHAITYAADNGAWIMNISMGVSDGICDWPESPLVSDALDYAYRERGCLIVAASGNGSGCDVAYPASHSAVMAVGGSDYDGSHWDNSCHGNGTLPLENEVELVAPAVDILTTTYDPGSGTEDCDFVDGTSFSAPIVAGVAALIQSEAIELGIGRLSPGELRARLHAAARNYPTRDARVGYGVIDAEQALLAMQPGAPDDPVLDVNPVVLNFGEVEGEATDQFYISNTGTGILSWLAEEDRSWLTVFPSSGNTTTETDPVTVTVNTTGYDAGDVLVDHITVSSNGGSEPVEVVVEVGGNQCPSVTSGDVDHGSGNTCDNTEFTFTVEYRDHDNDPPTIYRLYIEGKPSSYDMSTTDFNYADGSIFTRTLTAQELGVGTHQHHYYFEDQECGDRYPDAPGWFQGPTVYSGPPSIYVFEPDGIGDVADDTYTIKYLCSDCDPGDSPSVSLYYDADRDPAFKTLVRDQVGLPAQDLDCMPDTNSFVWDVSTIPNGSYWIYGFIDDGNGETDDDYSTGMVTVSPPCVMPQRWWTGPDTVTTSGSRPAIAVGPDSTVHAVWEACFIYYSYSSDGGFTWSDGIQVSASALCAYDPEIATDNEGNAHIVWQQHSGTSGDLDAFYEKRFKDVTLVDDTDLSQTSTLVLDPDIAVDPNGYVHVVWADERSCTFEDIYYRRSTNGGSSWESSVRVIDGCGNGWSMELPAVSADDNDVYVVASDTWDDTIQFVRGSSSGASWGSPIRLDSGQNNPKEPDIAASGGTVHVVYLASTGLYYCRSTNSGGAWSSPIVIEDTNDYYPYMAYCPPRFMLLRGVGITLKASMTAVLGPAMFHQE